MNGQNLKISVITVVFNNKEMLKGTVESVLNQTYKNIEYIIVDGGSTDGTAELVRSYGDRISAFVSEPDKGLYDAMNKGLSMASGDVIGFLNSDDFYLDSSVLEKVAQAFEENKADCCYGDIQYVQRSDTDRIVRYWRSRPYEKGLLLKGWYPPHPAFFIKKEIFEKYGKFNTSFKISADYELTLRLLEKYNIRSCYIPGVLVIMRAGVKSNRSVKNIIEANIECYNAWKENDLDISILQLLRKPLNKISQYIIK